MSFLLGVILCAFAVALVAIRGGTPAVLFDSRALALVLCGTIASAFITLPFTALKERMASIWGALRGGAKGARLAEEILEYARVARHDGVLALENKVKTVRDPILRRGLVLILTSADHEAIRSILENDAKCLTHMEISSAEFFERVAVFAPGIGMVGTLVEIVQMLFRYTGPEALAPEIASALLPVVYGALLAYVVLLPLAARIRAGSERHSKIRRLCIEGVLAIQAGEPIHIVKERLSVFISREEGNIGDSDQSDAPP